MGPRGASWAQAATAHGPYAKSATGNWPETLSFESLRYPASVIGTRGEHAYERPTSFSAKEILLWKRGTCSFIRHLVGRALARLPIRARSTGVHQERRRGPLRAGKIGWEGKGWHRLPEFRDAGSQTDEKVR